MRAVNAELRYIQLSESMATDVTLGVAKGFDAAGAKKEISTNYGFSSVPVLDLDFKRFNLNAKQTFVLPAQFGLVLSAAGQYSSNILPSSEQVSFGSWRYAMGYPQGEQSGDKGVGASLEINRRFNTGWRYLSNVQPYALVDYARTWYNNASLQQLNQRHLSSVALGLSLPTTSTIYSISTSPSPSPPAPPTATTATCASTRITLFITTHSERHAPSRTNRGVDKSRYPRACCDRRFCRFPTSRYVTPDVT